MGLAMREAEQAYEEGEVPVGAVVVFEDKVIGRGYNRMAQLSDATAHAEMVALSAAYNRFGDWRLENCTIFCTLEPCAMCAGALVLSRVERIVYGAQDPKFGACGSIFDIPTEKKLNHRIEVVGGVMADEVARMMKDFFVEVRQRREGVN